MSYKLSLKGTDESGESTDFTLVMYDGDVQSPYPETTLKESDWEEVCELHQEKQLKIK